MATKKNEIQHNNALIADDDSDGDYVPEWLASFVKDADNTLLAAQRDFDRMADVDTNGNTTINNNSIGCEDILSQQDAVDEEIDKDEVVFDSSHPEDDMMIIPTLIDENITEKLSLQTNPSKVTNNSFDVTVRNNSNMTFTSTQNNYLAVMDMLHSSPEMKERYGPKVAPASVNIVEYSRDHVASQVPSITSNDISEAEEENSELKDHMVWSDGTDADVPTVNPPTSVFDNPFVDKSDRSEEEFEVDFGMPQSISQPPTFESYISDMNVSKMQSKQEVWKSELVDMSKQYNGALGGKNLNHLHFASESLYEIDNKDETKQNLDPCTPALTSSPNFPLAQQLPSIAIGDSNSYQKNEFKIQSEECVGIHVDEDLMRGDRDNATTDSTSCGSNRQLMNTDIDAIETTIKYFDSEKLTSTIGSAETENILHASLTLNKKSVNVTNDTSDFFNNLLLQESNDLSSPRKSQQPVSTKSKEALHVQSTKASDIQHLIEKRNDETNCPSFSTPLPQTLTKTETLEECETSDEPIATSHSLVKGFRQPVADSDLAEAPRLVAKDLSCSEAVQVVAPIRNTTSPLLSPRPATVDILNGSNDNHISIDKEYVPEGRPPLAHSSPQTKGKITDVTTGSPYLPNNSLDALPIPVAANSSQDLLLTHSLSESYDGHGAAMYDCARSVGKLYTFYFSLRLFFI
jgi:hypothetical protein